MTNTSSRDDVDEKHSDQFRQFAASLLETIFSAAGGRFTNQNENARHAHATGDSECASESDAATDVAVICRLRPDRARLDDIMSNENLAALRADVVDLVKVRPLLQAIMFMFIYLFIQADALTRACESTFTVTVVCKCAVVVCCHLANRLPLTVSEHERIIANYINVN